jgi:hypothetical protein
VNLVPRITQAAAAIDFAAAAAVHHGALTLRDVIIGRDTTGISGFGLYQALGHEVTSADDVRRLAELTLQLADERDHQRLALLIDDLPDTALAFAAAVQQIAAGSTIQDRTDLGTALNAAGPIASVAPAPSSDVPPSLSEMALDEDRLTLAPLADMPLGTEVFPDALLQWPSEAADEMPLHLDAEASGPVPESQADTSAAASPAADAPMTENVGRRNGLFAASAKGEVERANDEAARARDDAAVARDEAARAREDAERARADAARVREAAVHSSPLFSSTSSEPLPHRSSKRIWIPATIAASLLIGLLTGFSSGYFVAQQNEPPPPPAAAAPEPTATNGQAYTEAPLRDSSSSTPDQRTPAADVVPPSPQPDPARPQAGASPSQGVDQSRSARSSRSTSAPRETARDSRSRPADARTRTPRTESATGALFVDSHPAGAEVFVDDAPVGRTPLLLNDVRSGEHRVRLGLPGHRTWATSVDVIGGERTRVAASLEQGQE